MNSNMSQKYRDEMMRYYNMQKSRVNEPDNDSSAEKEENLQNTAAEPAVPDSETAEYDRRPDMFESVKERYPDPDISDFAVKASETSSYQTEPVHKMSTSPGYGKLRVEATSGNRSTPVEDVLVIITRSSGGSREVLATLLTDSSGSTQTIEISAPAPVLSGSPNEQVVSAVVDITAYKKGYYEVENKNIQVFTGITSIQPVNMVPLPLNAPDQKIVYTEQLPNL